MKCCDIERFVDPYLDNEFEARERTEIELHLAACEPCRQHVELQQSLRRVVAICARASAPASLHDRLVARLGLDCSDATPATAQSPVALEVLAPPSPQQPPPPLAAHPPWHDWGGWRYVSLGAAASLLLGLTTLGLLTEVGTGGVRYAGNLNSAIDSTPEPPLTDPVVEESLDWHRRRLPMEVTGPSSDEVRGWFQGKVDFPVRLPSFEQRNVAVLGGRLAKVGDHKAALVTLEVNHRKMSMMVFPQDGLTRSPRRMLTRLGVRQPELPRLMLHTASGYNVAIVRDGDIAYSFVSDLPQRELRQLVSDAQLR